MCITFLHYFVTASILLAATLSTMYEINNNLLLTCQKTILLFIIFLLFNDDQERNKSTFQMMHLVIKYSRNDIWAKREVIIVILHPYSAQIFCVRMLILVLTSDILHQSICNKHWCMLWIQSSSSTSTYSAEWAPKILEVM